MRTVDTKHLETKSDAKREAEAMARLRVASSLDEAVDFGGVRVRLADLRALLDAYTEALDALVGALHVLRESDAADVWEEETDAVKAVLAKAGRR